MIVSLGNILQRGMWTLKESRFASIDTLLACNDIPIADAIKLRRQQRPYGQLRENEKRDTELVSYSTASSTAIRTTRAPRFTVSDSSCPRVAKGQTCS
jgi:hypothetical protein